MPKKELQNTHVQTFSKPSIRVLITPGKDNTWKGCLYYSNFDRTSEMLSLLNSKNGNTSEVLMGNRIHFFTSKVKGNVESNITKTIKSYFLKSEHS